MKKDIHPKYFKNAKISCACGAIYEIGSTSEEIQVELCSKCHPFYTGEKQKILDTARRVEKFTERAAKKSAVATGKKVKQAKHADIKAKKAAKKLAETEEAPKAKKKKEA